MTMVATESWPANLRRARDLLGPRGVSVIESSDVGPLPLPDESFELVIARHPVRPDWQETHRVLLPGGTYFAQHVGPASAFELIEHFCGPLPEQRMGRDPYVESAAARNAGLVVTDLRTARCRMEFYDVGAVVGILRNVSGGYQTSPSRSTSTSLLNSMSRCATTVSRSSRTPPDISSKRGNSHRRSGPTDDHCASNSVDVRNALTSACQCAVALSGPRYSGSGCDTPWSRPQSRAWRWPWQGEAEWCRGCKTQAEEHC